MSRLVSTNQLLSAAIELQLKGRQPETHTDWKLVLNFVAYNTEIGLEKPICKLFVMIYDLEMAEGEVDAIAEYQLSCKLIESAIPN